MKTRGQNKLQGLYESIIQVYRLAMVHDTELIMNFK